MTKKEIIADYCKRFSSTSNLALARKLYSEHARMFKDIDAARSSVRMLRGANGPKSRKVKTELTKPLRFSDNFGIPVGEAKPFLPFVIPNKYTRLLGLMDVHMPHHCTTSLNIALQYGIDHKANAILINGDLIDFYGISRWDKDPRATSLKEEIEMAKTFFVQLRKLFPKAFIVYKLGNHEERWEKNLIAKAPELLDFECLGLSQVLGLDALKIHLVDEKRTVMHGLLPFKHGHEMGNSFAPPVNAARGLYLKAKTTAVIGHHHATSYHSEKDLNGKVTACWSVGCLCDLNPAYMPHNKWNNGFCFNTITDKETGEFSFNNLSIIEGKLR